METVDLYGILIILSNRPNGQIYKGNWVNNELDGEVIIYQHGKPAIKSQWKNGVLINGVNL